MVGTGVLNGPGWPGTWVGVGKTGVASNGPATGVGVFRSEEKSFGDCTENDA